MSPRCYVCNRGFISYDALNQHCRASAAHSNERWECDVCDRRFGSEMSLKQHMSSSAGHYYCSSCNRLFRNQNNLTQHLRSKIHQHTDITCPFCKRNFATASGMTVHLESGTCKSGLDRHSINNMIRRLDRHNVITQPLLEYNSDSNVQNIATERAYNRYTDSYECYLCNGGFRTLASLNSHMRSAVHEMDLYNCRNGRCGSTFKLLSGLVMHIESESCGLMRFATVQREARTGVQNMVGRMIQGYWMGNRELWDREENLRLAYQSLCVVVQVTK
ncbi:hypothetical protein F5884DRAFT_744982 [Xylogone sp. PMI_703]|nr:hypothetical protein F5884DRAFT_744982 [Xylogone sp. PMI_703]